MIDKNWLRTYPLFAWLKKHPVIILNVLVLIATFVLAYRYYAGTLSAGDAIYTFSMRGGDYGDSPIELLVHWYLFINGRITQALLAAALMLFSYLSPVPEAYPWWIISWLEIFCVLAAPVNLVIFFHRLFGMPKRFCILSLAILWSLWSINDIIYAPAHMHQSVEGYYLPVYFTSLAFLWLSGQNVYRSIHTKRYLITYAMAYLFISMVGEQFFPSVPVLFLSILVLSFPAFKDRRVFLRYFLVSILLTFFTIVIFFSAPGQHIRSSNVNASFDLSIFSIKNLTEWFVLASSYGYDALFHWQENLPAALNVNFFLFDWKPNFNVEWLYLFQLIFPFMVLVLAIYTSFKQKRKIEDIDIKNNRYVKTGFISTVFHLTYLLIMSTLLISDYFPLYTIIYPAMLLVSGLCLNLYLGAILFQKDDDNPFSRLLVPRNGNFEPVSRPALSFRSLYLEKKAMIFSICSACLVSLGITPFLLTTLTVYYKTKTLLWTAGGLTLLLSVMIHLILFYLTVPLMMNLKNSLKISIMLFCALFGYYIWHSFFNQVPLPSTWYEISIETTGQRNSSAKGNEIWIGQIENGDGETLPANKWTLQGDWQKIDGFLVSSGNVSASITTRIRSQAGKELKLLFSEHENAGQIEISVGKITTMVDLYTAGIGGDHIEIIHFPGEWWYFLLSAGGLYATIFFISILLTWLFVASETIYSGMLQQNVAISSLLVMILVLIGKPNLQDVFKSYQVFNYTQRVRHLTYQKITELSREQDIEGIYLIHCPKKSYYNHYGFDSPWGIDSNLLWRGIGHLEVAVDQDDEMFSLDRNKNYLIIECEYPNEEY